MNDVRERMQETLSYVLTVLPPNTGVMIMAFGGGEEGRVEYASNCRRQDVVHAMRRFVEFCENDPKNYGRHVEEGPAAPGQK
jgi:hypothetical protein